MKKGLWLLLIAFIFVGCSDTPSQDEPNETNTEDVGEADTTENDETDTETFDAGMYKIGEDMPAGEYVIETNSTRSTYIEVASDASGTIDSIIMNDNFYNRIYITVSDGEYLTFRDGVATLSSDAEPFNASNGLYPSGMYLVGKDIEAGEYRISVEEDSYSGFGYYEVTSDSLGLISSIIVNSNIDSDTYQALSDGEYIKLSGTYIQQ